MSIEIPTFESISRMFELNLTEMNGVAASYGREKRVEKISSQNTKYKKGEGEL